MSSRIEGILDGLIEWCALTEPLNQIRVGDALLAGLEGLKVSTAAGIAIPAPAAWANMREQHCHEHQTGGGPSDSCPDHRRTSFTFECSLRRETTGTLDEGYGRFESVVNVTRQLAVARAPPLCGAKLGQAPTHSDYSR